MNFIKDKRLVLKIRNYLFSGSSAHTSRGIPVVPSFCTDLYCEEQCCPPPHEDGPIGEGGEGGEGPPCKLMFPFLYLISMLLVPEMNKK